MISIHDIRALRPDAGGNSKDRLILSAAFAVYLALAGWLIAGIPGAAVGAALAVAIVMLADRMPAGLLLRLYRARPVEGRGNRQLLDLMNVLSYRAQLHPAPGLHVIPSLTLSAFSAGDGARSVIAVTEGLLRKLSTREIGGILAHEISHIRNGDLGIWRLTDVVTRIAQALSYFALMLAVANLFGAWRDQIYVSWWAVLLLYLAPLLSSALQLALPRDREFAADRDAVRLTGDPIGLASALSHIEDAPGSPLDELLYPVPARRVPQPSLLRVHPSRDYRIPRLLEQGEPAGVDPIVVVEQPMVTLAGFGPIEMRPRYRWPGIWF
jgi:heat shock protein HtpX